MKMTMMMMMMMMMMINDTCPENDMVQVIRDEIDGMKRKEECHSVLRRVVDKALQVHYAHTTVTRLKNSLDRRVLEYDKQQQISPPIEASVSSDVINSRSLYFQTNYSVLMNQVNYLLFHFFQQKFCVF